MDGRRQRFSCRYVLLLLLTCVCDVQLPIYDDLIDGRPLVGFLRGAFNVGFRDVRFCISLFVCVCFLLQVVDSAQCCAVCLSTASQKFILTCSAARSGVLLSFQKNFDTRSLSLRTFSTGINLRSASKK